MRWPRARRRVYPGESVRQAVTSLPKRGGIVTLMPGTYDLGSEPLSLPPRTTLRSWLPWWRRFLRLIGI